MGETAQNRSNKIQLMAFWETVPGDSNSRVTLLSLNCKILVCMFLKDLLFIFYLLVDDLEIQHIVSNITLSYFLLFFFPLKPFF